MRFKSPIVVPLSILFITCLGIVLYSNTLHCSFEFDDYLNIVYNPFIKNIGHLGDIWTFYPCRFITFFPGCEQKFVVVGGGKEKHDVVTHVCKKCGSTDAFCCVHGDNRYLTSSSGHAWHQLHLRSGFHPEDAHDLVGRQGAVIHPQVAHHAEELITISGLSAGSTNKCHVGG